MSPERATKVETPDGIHPGSHVLMADESSEPRHPGSPQGHK